MKYLILALAMSGSAFAAKDESTFVKQEHMKKILNKAWMYSGNNPECPAVIGMEQKNHISIISGHENPLSFYSLVIGSKGADAGTVQMSQIDYQIHLGEKYHNKKVCTDELFGPKRCNKLSASNSDGVVTLSVDGQTKMKVEGKTVKLKADYDFIFDTNKNQAKLVVSAAVNKKQQSISCEYAEADEKAETKVSEDNSDRSAGKDVQEKKSSTESTSSSATKQ